MPVKRPRGVSDAITRPEPETQRLNVRLDPDAHKRLMVHCVMSGQAPGKYLARLINDHCREWRVQGIGPGRSKEEDRPESAGGVKSPATSAA